MADSSKMGKVEWNTASRAFKNIHKAQELLKLASNDLERLLELGWDIDAWEIDKARAAICDVGMEIAECFGYDEGWAIDDKEGTGAAR